ncbi:NADPH-dependent FMN reductase [Paenibacillus hamazuiensis]|uniref:NADPH-dependent FMN reductase n=1 Tax=Paenibacillus hamazuiensis TaxID=2936508 RepID=UPI00200BA652|nr:NADPH-dependent FMN reductase [Paenibacillus hamazuiensis]
MSKIVIISGSPSETSRLNGITDYVSEQLYQAGVDVEWIRVHKLPPEDLIHTRFDSPAIQAANRAIEEADGVVVATPIYKASYTGVIKTFLDLIPQKGLEGKTVLPLAIGGTIAHLLAIDFALKPVLSALGARNIFTGAYVVDSQVQRDESNRFTLADEIRERLNHTVREFVRDVQLLRGKRDTVSP